jgi:hypothetical protein
VNFALTRKLIIFGLVLPLAALIGFVLATPEDGTTFLLMAMVIGLLLMPVMLKWYHPLLIFTWNAFINVYFLPGKPQLWMLLAAIGFGIVVLNSTLDREKRMIHVPAITIPLLFFLAVVMITAKLTGGINVRALGGGQIGAGAMGGKGYFYLMFAVMGYFVLTSQAVPLERVKTYMSIFFLSGLTGVFSNLAYMLGPAFYFLFYLFPEDLAMTQAQADWDVGNQMVRVTGIAAAGGAAYFFMMVRFGIRGIFDPRRPWRLVCFAATIFISLLGGYRSLLITYLIHFAFQFFLEGLLRTRFAVVLAGCGIAAGALALPFMEKMPLSVQRCFAFLPGAPVSQLVKLDAEASTRWRTEMWAVLMPEIPKYLLVGKGYSLNPADLYLAYQASERGLSKSYEVSLASGAYHSGPLSLIIPFGIFGAIGFVWLMAAGIWVLYRNYRYGDPGLRVVNTFLLAYFIMRVIVFMFVFGAVDAEFYKFTGVLGLSVALNRGVKKAVHTREDCAPEVALQPA